MNRRWVAQASRLRVHRASRPVFVTSSFFLAARRRRNPQAGRLRYGSWKVASTEQNLKPSPGIDAGNHHPALSRTTVHALLKQLVGGGFARTLAASTTLVTFVSSSS